MTENYILRKVSSNMYEGVVCHDSDISAIAVNLVLHFNTLSKVKDLLKLGHLKQVGTDLVSTQAWARDFGEQLQKPFKASEIEVTQDLFSNGSVFFFDNNEWFYLIFNGDEVVNCPLAAYLNENGLI